MEFLLLILLIILLKIVYLDCKRFILKQNSLKYQLMLESETQEYVVLNQYFTWWHESMARTREAIIVCSAGKFSPLLLLI